MIMLNKYVKLCNSFNRRFVFNFVEKIRNISSDVKFRKGDVEVCAKSTLGLLSANFQDCDTLEMCVFNQSEEQAIEDLDFVERMIFNE